MLAGLKLVVAVLLLLSALGGTFALADTSGPSTDNGKVIRVLHDKTIYEINDPLRAAASLRSLAAEIGARTDLVPTYLDGEVFGVAGKQTLNLKLPSRLVQVSPEDRSFTNRLQGELGQPRSSEPTTAILFLDRPLSIDELAKLMESGVRVLERIAGGLLIRADGPRILQLADEPYAGWVGEYKTAYKYSVETRVSELNQYGLRYFGGFDEEFRRDLVDLGVTVEMIHEGLKRIVVNCNERALDGIERLAWVACISPAVVTIPDADVNEGGAAANGTR